MNAHRSANAFVLGCERSGSTWLSNVLDVNPNVELFMEPFADYAGLFPGFVGRNVYVDDQSNTMAAIVQTGYESLPSRKYSLFYAPDRSLVWKKVDHLLATTHSYLGKLLRFSPALRVRQFELLNLNQRKVSGVFQVRKNTPPGLRVTKELRLNFKIGLLRRVFPDAKFVIVVRHPGAQVTSILKMFRSGHLAELERSLLSLNVHLQDSRQFEKFASHRACLDHEKVTCKSLLFWWLINYQTAIQDCKRHNADYKIVFHEDLSVSPESEYRAVFSFLGLEFNDEVKAYLRHSTTGSTTRTNSAERSPLDTVRESAAYSRATILEVDEEVRSEISALFERFDVCDELTRYRSLAHD